MRKDYREAFTNDSQAGPSGSCSEFAGVLENVILSEAGDCKASTHVVEASQPYRKCIAPAKRA
jgi:hypothetical protein